jgi:hypothetical protein
MIYNEGMGLSSSTNSHEINFLLSHSMIHPFELKYIGALDTIYRGCGINTPYKIVYENYFDLLK